MGVRDAVILSLSCGAFYGYNSGIVSGISNSMVACYYFPKEPLVDTDLDSKQEVYHGLVTACILFGGIVGSVAGVPFADRYGRRSAYLFCSVLGLLTSLLAIVDNFWLTILVRTVIGFAVGGVTVLVPLYVTEVCEPSNRGSIGTIFQVSICFFILLSQILNYVFDTSYDPDDLNHMCVDSWKWKLQLGLGVVPAIAMLFHALWFFEESKDWLIRTGQVQVIEEEYEGEMVPSASFNEDDLPQPLLAHAPSFRDRAGTIANFTWKELLTTREGLGWAGVGAGLACSTQLTGINAYMFYGPQIFKDSGFDNVLVLTFSVIGTWNFLSVFVSLSLVDKLGRRPLMLTALMGMSASSLLLAASYGLLGSVDSSLKSVVTVAALMGFILFFEIGPGSLFFLMASESFPRVVRSKALVFTNVCCWLFNICISFGFPIIENGIGNAATFTLLGCIGLACTYFVYKKLPETKGDLPPTPAIDFLN